MPSSDHNGGLGSPEVLVDTTRLAEIELHIGEQTSANRTVNENPFVVDSCIVAGNLLGAGSGHAARSCVDWK